MSVMTPTPSPPMGSSAVASRWRRLAADVEAYDPTVVVLVARRAPRVAQALDLSFGDAPVVITDLALPYSTALLAGARVAIVDDVINVGSTVLRVRNAVREARAAETQIFAIARREKSQPLEGVREAHLLQRDALDDAEMDRLAAEVPELLQTVARPYDLDFPLMSCTLAGAAADFDTLLATLRDRRGADRVSNLTTRAGAAVSMRRLTVDLATDLVPHAKVRIYVDERSGSCSVVPIRLASPLPEGPPDSQWGREILAALAPETVTDRESRARARLFVDALQLGLEFLRDDGDLFVRDPIAAPFDVAEARLALGPGVEMAARLADRLALPIAVEPIAVVPVAGCHSPFLDAARERGLLDEVRERVGPSPDETTAFRTILLCLADAVGAADARAYRFAWPYSSEEIAREPYLRLRIGATLADLAAMLQELCPQLTGDVRGHVSGLLDRFVDDGTAVPTTAKYGGKLYRVYRKGEAPARDEVSDRLCRAWHATGKSLSRTRVTKLAAILAYTEDLGRSDVVVRNDTRGNVYSYARSVLRDETEVTLHLLRTGRLRRDDGRDHR